MDITQIFDKLDKGKLSVRVVGKLLFGDNNDILSKRKFVHQLLHQQKYTELVICIQHTLLHNVFASNAKEINYEGDIYSRYLDVFLHIAKNIDSDIVYPFFYSILSSRPKSYLYNWQKGVTQYLQNLTNADFNQGFDIALRYDKHWKNSAILVNADKQESIKRMLDLYIYGDSRQLRTLCNHMDTVVDCVSKIHKEADNNIRVRLIKLLWLDRHNPMVKRLVNEIVSMDSSENITKLIQSKYKKISPNKNSIIKKGSLYSVDNIEKMMIDTALWDIKELLLALQGDFGAIADRLVFLQHNKNTEPLLVHNGQLYDINNQPITHTEESEEQTNSAVMYDEYSQRALPIESEEQTNSTVVDDGYSQRANVGQGKRCHASCKISIMHPVDLPKQYSYIKEWQIQQPFAQLQRSVYYVNKDDISMRVVRRMSGTRCTKKQLQSAARSFMSLRDCGNSLYGRYRNIVIRYNYKQKQTDGNLTIDTIDFFDYNELTYLGARPLFDKSIKCCPSLINKRVFSETIRVVAESNLH